MLSFFSGLLGFSSTQNTSGSATNRELKRLERVSKELQRLETQASPLSPRRSTSSNVLPSTIKKVQEDSGKSHSLAISKVLSFDQISDMGENTPTAEMCSHSQPLLRNISDDKEATAVVAKRKRDTETTGNAAPIAEQLTPPQQKKPKVESLESANDLFSESRNEEGCPDKRILGEKRKAYAEAENPNMSAKRPAIEDTVNVAIESSSSSKRKASSMVIDDDLDNISLAPHVKVAKSENMTVIPTKLNEEEIPKHKNSGTPKNKTVTTPGSKSRKSPAYYRNLAKACRAKRLRFSAI